jgi:hypothetical protein
VGIAPIMDSAALQPSDEHALRIEPFHLLLPIAAAAALLISLHPFQDPDFFWHVRLGGEIWRSHSVSGAGSGWTILPSAHHWTSPEWLSDVLYYWLVRALGWQAALIYQFVASVAFILCLAITLLRRGSARAVAPVFAIVVVTLAPYLQPRPQTVSFVFIAILAGWCDSLLRAGRLPRPWLLLGAVLLWAQIHGLWVLAPAFIGAVALLRLLDDRSRESVRLTTRGLVLAFAAAGVGCINPLGVASLLLPFRLAAATGYIAEWQPTSFTQYMTCGVPICIAALVYLWVRSNTRVQASEMAWVALLVAFALVAFRNVPTSLILLAPLLVGRIGQRVVASRTAPREQRLLVGLTAALAAVAVAVGATVAATIPPMPSDTPVALAQRLDDGHPHRVLDDYNLGGLILAFGGPNVRVAVDGRADYFGNAYLQQYHFMMQLHPGWKRLYQRLRPDTALLSSAAPMVAYLLQHGWTRIGRHGGFSLFVRHEPGLASAS